MWPPQVQLQPSQLQPCIFFASSWHGASPTPPTTEQNSANTALKCPVKVLNLLLLLTCLRQESPREGGCQSIPIKYKNDSSWL